MNFDSMTNLEMIAILKKDPLVRMYHDLASKTDAALAFKFRQYVTPVHSLGEKKYMALGILTTGVHYRVDRENRERFRPDHDTSLALASGLLASECVVFTVETFNLFKELWTKVGEAYSTMGAAERPSPKRPPFQDMWLALPCAVELDGILIDSLMVWVREDKLRVIAFSYDKEYDAISVTEIGFQGGHGQAFLDSLCLFLEEKLMGLETIRPKWATRQRLAELGLNQDELAHVVSLRAVDSGGGKSSMNSTESAREYCHRWIVRGFIRMQWYPSRQCHEMIWIDPQVRGPVGAPFKETVRHVHR